MISSRLAIVGAVALLAISCRKSPPTVEPVSMAEFADPVIRRDVHFLSIQARGPSIWATGRDVHGVIHFDGATWSEDVIAEAKATRSTGQQLLLGAGAADVWWGGTGALSATKTASGWQTVTIPGASNNSLRNVISGAVVNGSRLAILVGEGEVYKEAPEGTWTRASLPITERFLPKALWSSPTRTLLAVVTATNPGRWKMAVANAGKWTAVDLPLQGHIAAIHGSADDNAWIVGMVTQTVGKRPLLMHYDGARFKEHTFSHGTRFNAVYVHDKSHALAVGERGLVAAWNGSQWRRVSNPHSNKNLLAVTGAGAPGAYYVGGTEGLLMRLEVR